MDKPQKPNFWKTILVNTFIVYPLILLSEVILDFLLPMQEIHPKMGLFLSVLIVVVLMAWPVMPLVQKLLGKWINK